MLVTATLHYPGGSQVDKHSIGYSWGNNYISNLFGPTAINGSDNGARWWAVAGMIFLSAGFATFFVAFSERIPTKGASNIIKYVGASGMIFTFLIATPLHDAMITVASTMYLISIFYITVFILRSRLHAFKALCIICLAIFSATLYMYGTRSLTYLPVMQKITFATMILLVLALHYFTNAEDFQPKQAERQS
ncbi:hypothetical protein [Mucilaginibacter pedocola]|uniref:hypothetical protein n=1 Tax=Mucilaginibacter pedocola TaxID=1792845 RepID=UPI00138FFDCD|nr:hypothetical protein [Mucilaginibacter pedocola]